MDLLTPILRDALSANAIARDAAHAARCPEPDPAPVVKFFNPLGGAAQGSGDAQHRWNGCGGAATWLATEIDADGDTLFGLADLGFQCPERGYFSLREIAAVRLPFGLGIERDLTFASAVPLSVWADAARREGSIAAAEQRLARTPPSSDLGPGPDPDQLPPADPAGG